MEQVEQHKKALLEALEACNGVVSEACRATGIGRTTYYRYLKEDEEFKLLAEDAQEVALDYVETKLFQNISRNDTTAIIFYLKTKGKKRGYVERTEHTGKDGNNLYDTVTDEQLNARIAELLRKITPL